MAEQLNRNIQWWLVSRPQFWLGMMLLCLHIAFATGLQDIWSRAFLLSHFGFFLLWQPVLHGQRQLAPVPAVLIILGGLALFLWSNWWLLTLWLAVLISLVGSSTATDRGQRAVRSIAAGYLLSLLLIWAVPHLFVPADVSQPVTNFVQYVLVLAPLAIMFVRTGVREEQSRHALDFVYSLILFLLVMVLVLGSFAVKMTTRGDYLMALAQTLVVLAAGLLILGWLWTPRGAFAGLGQLLSRYLLSVGLPFERWLQTVAALAEQETDPDTFLKKALQHIASLPWATGGRWSTQYEQGFFGEPSDHKASFSFNQFTLELCTKSPMTPALMLHVKLLTQLLGYFYDAKRREKTQRENAYVQAIHETGARLTHDVKNLLQSLTGLCVAAEQSEPSESDALQALVKRQLPQIRERLETTLEKLKAPQRNKVKQVAAIGWWQELQQRYRERCEFSASYINDQTFLPQELFDSVAENLIENALNKKKMEPELGIRVNFSAEHGGALTVCDTGSPMDARVASRLFGEPMPSATGMGIGLYQAAQQARQLGYELRLESNELKRICFRLTRPATVGVS